VVRNFDYFQMSLYKTFKFDGFVKSHQWKNYINNFNGLNQKNAKPDFLQDYQACSKLKKSEFLTTGIFIIFCRLKFALDTEIG